MLTSKQRSILKGLAQTEDAIIQIGKGGITDNLIETTKNALRTRELIKVHVLDSALMTAAEAAAELAEAAGAEVVQSIGNRFVLFKRNTAAPVIDLGYLPKKKKTVQVKPHRTAPLTRSTFEYDRRHGIAPHGEEIRRKRSASSVHDSSSDRRAPSGYSRSDSKGSAKSRFGKKSSGFSHRAKTSSGRTVRLHHGRKGGGV